MLEVLAPTRTPAGGGTCQRCAGTLPGHAPAWAHAGLTDDGVTHRWLCLRCARPHLAQPRHGTGPDERPDDDAIGTVTLRQLAHVTSGLLAVAGALLLASLFSPALRVLAVLAVVAALCTAVGAVVALAENAATRRERRRAAGRAAHRTDRSDDDAVADLLTGAGHLTLRPRTTPAGLRLGHLVVTTETVYVVGVASRTGQPQLHPRLLHLAGVDETDLVDDVGSQVDQVRGTLEDAGARVGVEGLLCLVGATLPAPGTVAGVTVTTPAALGRLLPRPGGDPRQLWDLLAWHYPAGRTP